MENLTAVPGQLKALRAAAGLTQDKLAKRIKVGRVFVAQLESGARRPSADMLCDLAAALGCTVTDLLRPPPDGGKPRGRRKG